MEHRRETGVSIGTLPPDRQLTTFVHALFQPDDLVELRAIEPPPSDSKVRGTIVLREWLPAKELSNRYPSLQSVNEQGANIYFGVNPRAGRGGTKSNIQSCSHLWADLDECSVDDARTHWQRIGIEPSLIIDSGHGVHLYWKLRERIDLQDDARRVQLEGLLKNFYADLDSDSTQDVTRLLRLPGFLNVKREPVPCRIVEYHANLNFDLADFSAWQPDAERIGDSANTSKQLSAASLPTSVTAFSSDSIDMRRVRGLVGTLDRDSKDRSRRDFWVVCKLLSLGLSSDEVCQLVHGHSKFQTDEYTTHTVQKALRALRQSSE